MADSERTIDPDDAREVVGRGEAKVIDIRSLEEIASGKPPGSFAVGDGDATETARQVLRGESLPVIVIGSDEDRQAEVVAELSDNGIDAVGLDGGWSAWVSAGNQVMPQDDEEYDGPKLVQPGA